MIIGQEILDKKGSNNYINEIAKGYRNTELGTIPKDWDIKKLKEIAKRVERKNDGNSYDVLTISSKEGFLNQTERFNRVIAGKSLSKYILLGKGEFAYNKGNSKTYPFGCIYMLEDYEKALVPNVYYCFEIVNGVPEFYKHYFISGKLNRQLAKVINTGVRNDGLLNINVKDFFNVNVVVPSYDEQKKIASILSTWDKAIELKEKLIEQKKEQKKGLMQRLLTGEVRLSKNKENWKEEELEKVLENIVGGGTPSRKNPNYYNGGIPWATVKDMGNENYKDSTIENISLEGLKNSSAKLIEKNNLIISTRMGLGRCFINTVDMAINQDLKGLYPKKSKILVEYLMYYFKLKAEDLEKKGSGSTVKGITLSVLKKLKIYYPNLEAQQKIVDFLSNVDKEIELLTKEVNQLKKQKKGLMQLLLTGKVRVKV